MQKGISPKQIEPARSTNGRKPSQYPTQAINSQPFKSKKNITNPISDNQQEKPRGHHKSRIQTMSQSPDRQTLAIKYPTPIGLECRNIADLAEANQGESLPRSQAGVSARSDLQTRHSGFPTLYTINGRWYRRRLASSKPPNRGQSQA
jgi:hypothetical protein